MTAEPSPRIRIELLGRVRAWRDEQELAAGPPRRRAVLAVLALRANELVTRDEIIDAVWGEEPPASAVNGVHLYVGALRQVLEPERRRHEASRLLVGMGPGYQLRLAPGQLDVHRLATHLRRAKERAAGADPAGAVAAFDAALALWHGTPLAGVTGPFADAERLRLEELRLGAVEGRADAMLLVGRQAELVPELSRAVVEHPLRERLRALLMIALHRCGRRAEALTVFGETRRVLLDELGIEPGEPLQRLHHQILTGQDTDDAGRAGVPPTAAHPTRVVPRQLPAALRHFAGRADEVGTLDRLAGEAAAAGVAVVISAIDGTAGIGKTALAVHWAHGAAQRFPDGQLYVDLRGFHPSGQPMTTVEAIRGFLDALGVPAQENPVTLDAAVGLYRSLLADRRMLVVLDNARDADQVRPLLPGSPTCLVVVTSRRRLTGLVAVEGARSLTLNLLPAPEARQLLASRLGEQRVSAETAAVDGIVAACAGLPLALALVAARAAAEPPLPLHGLADELRPAADGRLDRLDRLDAFDVGDPGADVRSVFSWSYRMLGAAARRLFRLLGPHPGPDVTVAAAASLAGMPVAEVRPLLAELVRVSLVTERVPGRYVLHDLLRAYAAELASTDPAAADGPAATHRLLDHYLHTALAADTMMKARPDPVRPAPLRPGVSVEHFADGDAALAWFTAEHNELLAVVRHAAATGFDVHVWQLAWALAGYLDGAGHWPDWADTQAAAVAATERLGDRVEEARARRGLALASTWLGRHDDAERHLRRADELYQELGDHVGQAHNCRVLNWLYERQGRLHDALCAAELAVELYRKANHRRGQAIALNAVGWTHAQLGDHARGLRYCQEAVVILQEIGNVLEEAATWDSIGFAHHNLGDYDQAVGSYERALDLCRGSGGRYDEADILTRLGDSHHSAGRPDAARAAWQDALVIFEELDHPDAERVRTKLA